MKKTILGLLVLWILGSTASAANWDVRVNFGVPVVRVYEYNPYPVYYVAPPPPVYYTPAPRFYPDCYYYRKYIPIEQPYMYQPVRYHENRHRPCR